MMNQRTWKFVLAAFMAGSAAAAPAAAQAAETVFVDINHSQNLHVAGGISRVAVANPEIADVNVLSGRDLLVVAKKAGATTLFVWGSNGARYDYIVSVSGEDSAGSASIQHLIGYPNVKVDKIGNQILLTGRVQNQDEKQRAESIASMYSEKVVNMLEMVHPLQVRIQAQIIEVNRGKTKDLGIDWGNASSIDSDTGIVTVNSGSFSFGQNASNSKVGSVFGKLGTYAGINATLNALIANNDAKILSQPHMITMSGTRASILVGGQMPVPTTNSNGSSNVEWKNYGIELDIEPVADPDGNITCKVKASVSTLSSDAGSIINGTTLKGLVSREATSEISLASGGTMIIGGLLSSEDSKNMSKIPLLGDLPIIGQFFRSASTSHTEKELLILITPTLVDATSSIPVTVPMKDELGAVGKAEQARPAVSVMNPVSSASADTAVPASAAAPKAEKHHWLKGQDRSIS
jgi:pilus assembly protein CpaC